jgi:hypothetical protein
VLRHEPAESIIICTPETDEHGFFEFQHTSLRMFKLEITGKRISAYSADVYIPSDFAGNWAVELKTEKPESELH